MDLEFTHIGSCSNLLGTSPSRILVDSLSNAKQVTAKTPPAFLFHSRDDNVVPVKNAQAYYDRITTPWRSAALPPRSSCTKKAGTAKAWLTG